MPRLKACPYCGRIHRADGSCDKKPKREKAGTAHTRLRTCRLWDKTRRAVRERDRHLCRVCLAAHTLTADGLETHHILPLAEAPERAYDLDNLLTLCVRHHKAADAGRIPRDWLLRLAKEPPEGVQHPPRGAGEEPGRLPDTTRPPQKRKSFRNEKRKEAGHG